MEHLSVLAFADDLTLLCRNEIAAKYLITVVTSFLHKIGLQINTNKSKTISLHKGQLVSFVITIADGSHILSKTPEQNIKYLTDENKIQ